MTGTPLRPFGEDLRHAASRWRLRHGHVPEGLNSLRGETAWGTDGVRGAGLRERPAAPLRRGVQLHAGAGRLCRGMDAGARTAQGAGPGRSRSSPTSSRPAGTRAPRGSSRAKTRKTSTTRAVRSLPVGIGAIEVGARYEQLWFESAEKIGAGVSESARRELSFATPIRSGRFGVNWFANALDARGRQRDARGVRGSRPARQSRASPAIWSGVFRLQLVF